MDRSPTEKITIDPFFTDREQVAIGSVLLDNPKYAHNVGQALRACVDFLVPELWCSGRRIRTALTEHDRIPREERMRAYKDVALVWDENPVQRLSPEAVPVIIELVPGATDLRDFEHPQNAVYVFGPEDGSVSGYWRSKGHYFVKIDVVHCLNLATCVGIVLYDRELKDHHRRRYAST